MAIRTNILADHAVPDPFDRMAVLERVRPALPETLAIRDTWIALDPQQRTKQGQWEVDPPLPLENDKLICYDAPGGLSLSFGFGFPVAQLRASLRWQGFLSIAPLRHLHLLAFRKIAGLLGATRMICLPDDELVIDNARWEGATLDECAAQLREAWGPPQPTVEEIAPEIVQAVNHGVPRVWFLESISPDDAARAFSLGSPVVLWPELGGESHDEAPPRLTSVHCYDDRVAVKAYLDSHWKRYMTDFERKCHRLAARRVEAILDPTSTSPQAVLAEWEQAEEATRHQIAPGLKEFERAVRERIFKAWEDGQLRVNRCPRCGRVVRTPLARQCFWCGFDWHG